MIADEGHQASTRAIHVVRLVSTEKRTERPFVTVSSVCILSSCLWCLQAFQRNKHHPNSSHTKLAANKNSSHSVWLKKHSSLELITVTNYITLPHGNLWSLLYSHLFITAGTTNDQDKAATCLFIMAGLHFVIVKLSSEYLWGVTIPNWYKFKGGEGGGILHHVHMKNGSPRVFMRNGCNCSTLSRLALISSCHITQLMYMWLSWYR